MGFLFTILMGFLFTISKLSPTGPRKPFSSYLLTGKWGNVQCLQDHQIRIHNNLFLFIQFDTLMPWYIIIKTE